MKAYPDMREMKLALVEAREHGLERTSDTHWHSDNPKRLVPISAAQIHALLDVRYIYATSSDGQGPRRVRITKKGRKVLEGWGL